MHSEEKYTVAYEMMLNYIHEHKMRDTHERRTLLQNICTFNHSFTANDLIAKAGDTFISPATVYNTLQMLADAHIIHPLNVQQDTKLLQYELLLEQKNYVQIVCTRCGRIAEMKEPLLRDVIMNRPYYNFKPMHFSLYVYGECKQCRRHINKKKK